MKNIMNSLIIIFFVILCITSCTTDPKIFNPPRNLHFSSNNTLSWQPPLAGSSQELKGYIVYHEIEGMQYRRWVLVATIEEGYSYNLPTNERGKYRVTALYESGESRPSNTVRL